MTSLGKRKKVLTVAQQSAKELHKELSGEHRDLLEICIGTHWELYKYDNQASHEDFISSGFCGRMEILSSKT